MKSTWASCHHKIELEQKEVSGGGGGGISGGECVEQKENRSVKRVPHEVQGATVTWGSEVGCD